MSDFRYFIDSTKRTVIAPDGTTFHDRSLAMFGSESLTGSGHRIHQITYLFAGNAGSRLTTECYLNDDDLELFAKARA